LRRLALPFLLFPGLLPLALAGCHEGYSPNTYASTAAQQEATVQRGVIIGVRPVLITADGTIGAAAGGAAGGVAGAQASGGPVTSAFGAVGGALVGGIGGAAAEQAVADAKGWEYIVQETGGSLVSVTQTSKMALPVGQHVLVIDGKQARIVPDYTVQIAATPPAAKPPVTKATKTTAAPNVSTTTPIHVSPLPPAASAAGPVQAAPVTEASGPTVPSASSPASANPTATPLAPSSTSGEAATPEAVSNRSSSAGTPSAGSRATSVQVAPGEWISIPPLSSSSTATP
jgi:outer membrane lipoprotein SlyB